MRRKIRTVKKRILRIERDAMYDFMPETCKVLSQAACTTLISVENQSFATAAAIDLGLAQLEGIFL